MSVASAGLLMMTLSACGSFVKPEVSLPQDCERLARQVPAPAMKAGDDARAALARHRAALATADARLRATADCQRRLRERYAKGSAQ